jgi:hypothetical protein
LASEKKKHKKNLDTKQEAALTYDREARQCGEDKPLNYESIEAAEEAAVQARQAPALVRVCVCVNIPQQGKLQVPSPKKDVKIKTNS